MAYLISSFEYLHIRKIKRWGRAPCHQSARNEDRWLSGEIRWGERISPRASANKPWNAIKAAILPRGTVYVYTTTSVYFLYCRSHSPLTSLRLSWNKYRRRALPKKVMRGKNKQRKYGIVYNSSTKSVITHITYARHIYTSYIYTVVCNVPSGTPETFALRDRSLFNRSRITLRERGR